MSMMRMFPRAASARRAGIRLATAVVGCCLLLPFASITSVEAKSDKHLQHAIATATQTDQGGGGTQGNGHANGHANGNGKGQGKSSPPPSVSGPAPPAPAAPAVSVPPPAPSRPAPSRPPFVARAPVPVPLPEPPAAPTTTVVTNPVQVQAEHTSGPGWLHLIPPAVLPTGVGVPGTDLTVGWIPLLVAYSSLSLLAVVLGVMLGLRVARRVR
jgi:hypothetical protein